MWEWACPPHIWIFTALKMGVCNPLNSVEAFYV